MRNSNLLVLGVSIALSGAALGDVPAKSPKVVKPTEMTCEEFLSFDEVTRPQIVYWSEGFTHKERVKNIAFDVDRTNSLVPVLVEDCTKEPQASYWSKMKREFHMD
jgi:acid stress chaperone HdeA